MFKLVVLSVVLAVVAARPGYLHTDVVAVAPVASSYSSRVDYHSKPLVAVHAAPLVHAAPIVATPLVHSAPIIAAPAAVSHQSRVDVHSTAYIAAVPAVHSVVAAPVVHAW